MPATSPVKSTKLPVKTPFAATKTPPPSPPATGRRMLPFQAWQFSKRLAVKVASPRTLRQPPSLSPLDFASPLRRVRPETATVAPAWTVITRMRFAPEIASSDAPGPVRVMSSAIRSCCKASSRVIVHGGEPGRAKRIVSPSPAAAIASRSEQSPRAQLASFSSAVMSTVQSSARTGGENSKTRQRPVREKRQGRRVVIAASVTRTSRLRPPGSWRRAPDAVSVTVPRAPRRTAAVAAAQAFPY